MKGLADRICEALAKSEKLAPLRAAARRRIVEKLDMKTCCIPALERYLTGE